MKKEKREELEVLLWLFALIFIGVILINARIEQTQKIDTEVSIIENR